jgi:hypothetical protein
VRLITRGGYNWSKRYRWIVESALKNRYKQFVIDGEAVILGVDGISDFNALHSGEHNDEVQLYAFDILALDGDDLRSLPLSMRKAHLEPALSGLQELLRPAVIHRGGNAFPAAQLRDVLLAAQSFQHNADLLFGRILLPRRPADVADKLLGRTSGGNGFLSRLRSLAATMSQKSSVPQAAKFVSQALKRDNF